MIETEHIQWTEQSELGHMELRSLHGQQSLLTKDLAEAETSFFMEKTAEATFERLDQIVRHVEANRDTCDDVSLDAIKLPGNRQDA